MAGSRPVSVVVLRQIDTHQGRGRVEQLDPNERSDDALSLRFRTFAAEECSGESGLNVVSPTYEALSLAVASNACLLDLARECLVGQPIPNLFFSAVKRVLADYPDDSLSDHYARCARDGRPTPGLAQAFSRFCSAHDDGIRELVSTRRVQTNEIRRCSYLMPAFGVIASEDPGRPLALIDVGSSAGLNLLWDSYQYRYSDGSSYGPADSDVLIEAETRTPMPSIPERFPTVSFRTGIDLSPVDLSDDEEYRWMMALVWPDHTDRSELLAAARKIWLEDTPTVLAGDAVALMPNVLANVPADAVLCVFHCHTLNQFPVEARSAFYEVLMGESERRIVYHVPSEGERMSVDRIANRQTTTLLSARRNAHGRWIEWDYPK